MWRLRYRSKYSNKSQTYKGITYHSKKEASFAEELDYRMRAGDIKCWSRQEQISLDVNGYHICNYYIDFVIEHNDGTKEFIEIKGFSTDVWRLKWKLFEALYSHDPNIKLTVVK